tara:strand:+ start:3925 stop:4479 length:555 start_codon:yes stop_codon:yes gene_type:complete
LPSKVRFLPYLFLSLIFFALDQITKLLIKARFSEYLAGIFRTPEGLYEISIIDPILTIKRTSNKGIAFGIDSEGNFAVILTFITVILAILIIYALYKASKKSSLWFKLSLSLILGGALGNLFDRIVYGEVVDFIGLFQNIFPFIFNLADTFVTIGMCLLIFCHKHMDNLFKDEMTYLKKWKVRK